MERKLGLIDARARRGRQFGCAAGREVERRRPPPRRRRRTENEREARSPIRRRPHPPPARLLHRSGQRSRRRWMPRYIPSRSRCPAACFSQARNTVAGREVHSVSGAANDFVNHLVVFGEPPSRGRCLHRAQHSTKQLIVNPMFSQKNSRRRSILFGGFQPGCVVRFRGPRTRALAGRAASLGGRSLRSRISERLPRNNKTGTCNAS